MSKERFEWIYNEKVLKHYIFDNLEHKQLAYKDIIYLLNKQCQQIDQLKQQLTEKEQEIEQLKQGKKNVGEEKEVREFLETLSKDQVVELCLQYLIDVEITEKQLDQANERLKGAIVSKFKIGQEVWFISDPDVDVFRKVRHIKVEDISISSFFTERGIMYSGGDWAGLSENELFATKEEAEKKLQELRGGE